MDSPREVTAADLAVDREIICEYRESVARQAATVRTVRAGFTAALVASGVALLAAGAHFFGISSLVAAAAMFLLFLDAHGHLHQVRQRPTNSLIPRIGESWTSIEREGSSREIESDRDRPEA